MSGNVRCAAILVAAGTSSRMEGKDKLFAELCGLPVLYRSARALCASEYIDELVIVMRRERIEEVRALCKDLPKPIAVVCGGESRFDSVQCGLRALGEECSLVAVHDGARPLVSKEVIDEAVAVAAKTGAAVPAVPLKDTVKVAKNSVVEQTPDRSALFAAQTPQVFDRALLRRALDFARENRIAVTDDASAVEALGHAVTLTRGSEENLKLTTPIDFCVAEAILRQRGTI